MGGVKAVEGQWYTDRASSDLFCVIAVDDIDGFIDVRDGYGDIDELDLAEWEAMDLVPCGAPPQFAHRDEADEHSQRR
jgi:hypothetical protein